jgi:hypothetical protein
MLMPKPFIGEPIYRENFYFNLFSKSDDSAFAGEGQK